MTWRETSQVSKSLTMLYDCVLYLLGGTPANRKLIHQYIDVWEYPDGRIEIRADGEVLQCRLYDKLAEVDQGAIIEHKRLSHVLQVAQALQAQRDNRRASGSPSRTNHGLEARNPERFGVAPKLPAGIWLCLESYDVRAALPSCSRRSVIPVAPAIGSHA